MKKKRLGEKAMRKTRGGGAIAVPPRTPMPPSPPVAPPTPQPPVPQPYPIIGTGGGGGSSRPKTTG